LKSCNLSLKDFDYHLPQNLIAKKPLKRREQARLLVIKRKTKEIIHDHFYNCTKYLPKTSIFILNNSKVIPARLLTKRQNSKGGVELFLLKQMDDKYSYHVLMRPQKRLNIGEEFLFNRGRLVATITSKEPPTVRFNKKNILRDLEKIGHMPLPPYIQRADTHEDRKYYQTVYAQVPGSVASPTAGLHFTNSLINKIKRQGHSIEKVTLHVNYGTFKPVEEENITKHQMHSEEYSVSNATHRRIIQKRKKGYTIVAVGTTSCRVLETIARSKKRKGSTQIFMYPGQKFKLTDILITNFHLPKSTLLMLVSAFGSHQLIMDAYKKAIQKKYRFYSYGDAMMII